MWDPIAMLGNLSGWIPGLNQLSLPSLPSLPTLPSMPSFTAPANNGSMAQSAPVPAAPPKQQLAPEPVAPAVPAAAPTAEAAPAPVVAAAEPATEVAPPVAVAPPKVETSAAAPAAEASPAPAPKAAEAVKATPAPVVVAVPVAPAPVIVASPIAPAPVVAKAVPAVNKVVLAGDALFKSGKSGIRDLSKDGKARLDDVIAKLKMIGDIEQIRVVGHADPTGNALSNRKLSEARAKSVKSYLIAKGIKPGVIISSGMGDTQPVVQCDASLVKDALKECHAPNRRVEIEIVAKNK